MKGWIKFMIFYKAMRILKAKASKTRHGSLSHSELRLMDVLKLYFSEGKITEKRYY